MSDMKDYLESIAALGRNGDTILAHINEDEANLLKALGGSGTTNPDTGLPEFFFEELLGGIGSLFGDAASGVGNFIGDLFGGAGNAVSDISGAFGGSGIGDAANIFANATEGAGNFASGISPGVDAALAGLSGGGVTSNVAQMANEVAGGLGGGSSFLSGLFGPEVGGALGGAGDWLGRNAGWLLPAGALGYAALSQPSSVPYEGKIKGNANALSSSAGQLTSPLLKGTPLPPGAQNAVDLAANAQAASVRNSFANMGLSGSSMEGQALQAVEQQKSAQTFQDALALATQGFSNLGAANSNYVNLANMVLNNDAQFTQALAALAGAMGRSSGLNYVRPA